MKERDNGLRCATKTIHDWALRLCKSGRRHGGPGRRHRGRGEYNTTVFEGVQHVAILSVPDKGPIILIGESHDVSDQTHMVRSLCRDELTQCNPNIDFVLEQGRHRLMHSAIIEMLHTTRAEKVPSRDLNPIKLGNYRRRNRDRSSRLDGLHKIGSAGDKVSCIGAMTDEAENQEVCTDMQSCGSNRSDAGIKFHICDIRSTLSHEGPYFAAFIHHQMSNRHSGDRIRKAMNLLFNGIQESIAYVSSAVEYSFGECRMDLPKHRDSPCGKCALYLREKFHDQLIGMIDLNPRTMSRYRLDPGLEACAFAKISTTHRDRLCVMFFGYQHTLNICRSIKENPQWGIQVRCEAKRRRGPVKMKHLIHALREGVLRKGEEDTE